jgi:hypothetical protein
MLNFALDTWYSGYYDDVDLDFDSVHNYFLIGGVKDEN